ncbi:hypothetical protein F5883DRAFT_546618 [Diaporthe sp. PMI_573]|nr:hypothetical protein F5883DRAFT_546618 [Diaporthaceae sp. PMI_573]
MDLESIRKPLKISIIGGSLAGLLSGIALKHAGHDVTIFEKEDNERQSHMAGVCLGKDGEDWLARHDRHSKSLFAQRSTRVQLLQKDGSLKILINTRRDISNWDSLYFRLRSLFDGYKSEWYPTAPPNLPRDGPVSFLPRHEILSLSRVVDHEHPDRVLLGYRDNETCKVSTGEFDLVIAADGPNSSIRTRYLPSVERRYVGYVAWRGTVPESDMSLSARLLFRRSVTVHRMAGNHHCLVYMIPGKHGSIQPGERYLNFLWYTNEPASELESIMTDGVDGHRHRYIVPAGRVQPQVWEQRVNHARSIPFPAPFLEVISKIERPFIQLITDYCSPHAALEYGRILLIGDALSLFRPHTAFSGSQAAYHALRTADYVNGKIGLAEWEEKVLRYSALHWSQSMFYGQFYQSYLAVALLYLVYHWAYCFMDWLKALWRNEERLLRAPSKTVEQYDDFE